MFLRCNICIFTGVYKVPDPPDGKFVKYVGEEFQLVNIMNNIYFFK